MMILNIRYPKNIIIKPDNNRIVHLHIIDIDNFIDIYGSYIDNIIKVLYNLCYVYMWRC